MSDINNTNPDPPDSTGNPNSFMVNPTPPEEGAESAIEVESAKVDATKSFVGTGMTELELEEGLPELKGAAIFVNGYHSNPIENAEQTLNNAIRDINPDHPNEEGYMQGESANERDRTGPDDIFTNEELEQQLPEDQRNPWVIDQAERVGNWLTPLSFNNDISKFWSYWNKKSNKFAASDKYGRYFNAYRNDHYINGSHGLASNGAHRIDHGIALGYNWALTQWDIKEKKVVDGYKEQQPYIESYSPPYRPVTVIAHSHGAAVGAGVALGVMNYAGELGWDQMALNMIFLGVHQPKNLTGSEYDEFIYDKVHYYEVNQDFPDVFGEGEQKGSSFLNRLAELFSREHDKLKQERGIVEHLQEITGDWGAFAERAVQFTFANDRNDIVTRDGDIPNIPSACNPDGDSKLFCTEYITAKRKPMSYTGTEDKKPMATDTAGTLVLSDYIANRRFEYGDLGWFPSDEEETYGKELGDFERVAIAWGNAFAEYKAEKQTYEAMTGRPYEYKYAGIVKSTGHRLARWSNERNPISEAVDDFIKDLVRNEAEEQYAATTRAYETMLERYAWLQEAQLYAHFGPVALIYHPRVLSDFPSDDLGTSSIWDRIKKAGQDMFYRVEYDESPQGGSQSPDKKKEKDKKYVENAINKKKLISTSIADTDYIKNVIDVFVRGSDKDKILTNSIMNPENITNEYLPIHILSATFNSINQLQYDGISRLRRTL